MLRNRIPMVSLLLLVVLILAISPASAAKFPEKGITLVIPWSPGGITDQTGRVFAPLFEKHLGKPVTILNRAGASGALGTDYAYSQPADGYNVLLSAETPGTFQVMGFSKLSFNDFDPLMMMVQDTKVLVVPGKSPYKTIDDLLNDIKARPGRVRMSYSGPGASGHIQGLLLRQAGLNVSMTPFGGGSESMLATIGSQVEFTFGNTGTVLDYVRSGDLRVLAIFSVNTEKSFPEAPPLSKSLPSIEPYLNSISFPNCLLVKKGTPRDVQQVLLTAAEAAVREKAWIDFTDNNFLTRMHHLKGQAVSNYWGRWSSVVSWLLFDAGVTKTSPAEFGIPKP